MHSFRHYYNCIISWKAYVIALLLCYMLSALLKAIAFIIQTCTYLIISMMGHFISTYPAIVDGHAYLAPKMRVALFVPSLRSGGIVKNPRPPCRDMLALHLPGFSIPLDPFPENIFLHLARARLG